MAKDLIDGLFSALVGDPELESAVRELGEASLGSLSSPELIYNCIAEYAAGAVPALFEAALHCDEPNVNHWIAARMAEGQLAESIITTNFDRLIEACFSGQGVALRLEDDGPGTVPSLEKLEIPQIAGRTGLTGFGYLCRLNRTAPDIDGIKQPCRGWLVSQ